MPVTVTAVTATVPVKRTMPVDEYLDDLMNERDALIMRLRHIEQRLVQYNRLKAESLPRRSR